MHKRMPKLTQIKLQFIIFFSRWHHYGQQNLENIRKQTIKFNYITTSRNISSQFFQISLQKINLNQLLMYSRLKKRKIKVVGLLKKDCFEKPQLALGSLPSVNKQIEYSSSTLDKSHEIIRRRVQLHNHKKLRKPNSDAYSYPSSTFINMERNQSNTSKASLNKIHQTNLNISTKSWCLFDQARNKYLGFRQDYQRQIASLTKIMTTFLTLQIIQSYKISIYCKVKISQAAANMIGTTAQLKQNHWISLQDLLYGTMLPSGNDAAYALAEYMGYILLLPQINSDQKVCLKIIQFLDITSKNTNSYVQEFLNQMNRKANKLGLLSTRFSNPHGLQNAMNFSNARDILMLSIAASKNQKFRVIMNAFHWKYTLYDDEQGSKVIKKLWWNTNRLLNKDWQGIKTGHTNSAGSCLASLKDDIYIVVLNSQNLDARFSGTEQIFKWYLKKSSAKNCFKINGIHLKGSQRFKTQCKYEYSQATELSI